MLCHKIVFLFCGLGFLIHSLYNLYDNFSNDQKAVKMNHVDMGTLLLPVVFEISIIPGIYHEILNFGPKILIAGFNETTLLRYGYHSTFGFFLQNNYPSSDRHFENMTETLSGKYTTNQTPNTK